MPMRPVRHRLAAGGATWLLAAAVAAATPAVLADFAAVLPQLQAPLRAELHRRAAQWQGWTATQREAFNARVVAWDALPLSIRAQRRAEHAAWQGLPPTERVRVRAAAEQFAALPIDQQQVLRTRFDALDGSERRGWLLGPVLGADYPALQPLLAQLPAAQHERMRQLLRGLTVPQRADLAVLVQRTPPQDRAALRRELLSTSASQREAWLWERLDR